MPIRKISTLPNISDYDFRSANIPEDDDLMQLSLNYTGDYNSAKMTFAELRDSLDIVNKTDNQTINGVKTFTSIPKSSAIPSTDEDIVNKAYVDTYASAPQSMVEKYKDTDYTAEAFGFLLITFRVQWTYAVDVYVSVLSDDNVTPTTVVAKEGVYITRADSQNNYSYHSLNVPILKDKQYRIEDVTDSRITGLKILWLAVGS